MDRYEQILQQLTRLSFLITRAAEFTEAKAQELDRYLSLMARSGLLAGQVFVGDVIHRQPYGVGEGPQDSAVIYQAVIIADRGLGCSVLDMEEFLAAKDAETLDGAALAHFVPFAECPPFVRAIMLPQIEQLLRQLSQELKRHDSQLPGASS